MKRIIIIKDILNIKVKVFSLSSLFYSSFQKCVCWGAVGCSGKRVMGRQITEHVAAGGHGEARWSWWQ